MKKSLHSLISLLASAAILVGFASCSNDDEEAPLALPEAQVTVNSLERTAVQFTISSADATDYAYTILETGKAAPATAEELFENGTTGMLENGKAQVTGLDIEGDKEYTLYVAVRKINPYLYSKVYAVNLNTDIPFTKLLTMQRIGLTDFAYHVEKPETATKVKHIAVKKSDYEAIKGILAIYGGVDFPTYLKVFGLESDESVDHSLDKYSETAYGDAIHIYSGTPYYVIAAPVDQDGNLVEEAVQVEEITTRYAEELPGEFTVAINPTSTSAQISITPHEGVTHYRLLIDTREDYDYYASEGDYQVRNVIVGYWDDSKNSIARERTGAVQINYTGMKPLSDYVVGILAFDDNNREKLYLFDFRTTEPVGPVPEIEITQVETTSGATWKSAAVNVKVKNAVEIKTGFFPKAKVDEVLAGGATIDAIIANNSEYLDAAKASAALSAQGVTLEVDNLTPTTEYVFGCYAINDEYVGTCKTITFTTDEMPQVGGTKRTNMPGYYNATTKDNNGNTVTFPVVISAGFNDATKADYAGKNLLVAVGFGTTTPTFPADLMAQGKTEEEANDQYGPKWFIEFPDDNNIQLYMARKSGTITNNDPETGDRFIWNMGTINGKKTFLVGARTVATTGKFNFNDNFNFPVTQSSDYNTITIQPKQSGVNTYYPAMVTLQNYYTATDILFYTGDNIVLTRDLTKTAKAKTDRLTSPQVIRMTAPAVSARENGKQNATKQATKLVK